MTASELRFPYLGDNPAHVARLAETFTAAGESLSRVAQSLAKGRTMLNLAWTGAGSDLCDADVGVLASGLPTILARLSTAHTAVTDYQLTMSSGRREVDEIRSRWDRHVAMFDQAKASLDGLIGPISPAAAQQADADKATMHAADVAIDQLSVDYQALTLASNNAARTCCTSLVDTWNATGQPTGGTGPSAGMLLMTQSAMGGSSLGVLHTSQLEKLAIDAQADLAGLNDPSLNPADRNARITAILQDYSASASEPAFATALATGLGPGYFRDLQAGLGQYQRFWGAQGGSDNYQLDSRLFALTASVLAGATDSSKAWHVSDQWLHRLTHDDRGGVQPGWVMAAADYLRVGVPFRHDYLDEVGQSAIDWEKARPAGTGDPWQGWRWERFAGAAPLSDPPQGSGVDPLQAVMAQYAGHPDSASTLFSGGATDPVEGNLGWLLHRQWTDGGAQDLGAALAAMTSPASGDTAAAGVLAANVFEVVARGDEGNGTPMPWGAGELAGGARDGIADIAARYMGSINYANGGQEPGPDGLLLSGDPSEGRVAAVDFDHDGPSTAATLSWLLRDTKDTAVRAALYSGWQSAAAAGIGQDMYEAELANDHGDRATMLQEVAQTRAHTAGAAQTLGLISQSDITAFQDADARNVGDIAAARGGTKTGIVIIKELIGAAGVPGRVVSGAVGIVNNMFVDQVLTADPVAGPETDRVQLAASLNLRAMTAGMVTSLSSNGIPVISDYNLDTLVIDRQSATIPNIGMVQGAANFTDATGHLLPYDTIYAKDQDGNDVNPQAIKDFERWYGSTGFFGDSSGAPALQSEIEAAYRRGQDKALS